MEIECQKARYQKLISSQKVIFTLSVIGIVLGIALGILFFFVCLNRSIVWAVTVPSLCVFAGVAAYAIMTKKFYSNCKKICRIYKEAYQIPDIYTNVTYVYDNFDLREQIKAEGKKPLMAWYQSGILSFVSIDFLALENCRRYGAQFKKLVNADFGKLIITEREIVSYTYSRNATHLTLKAGEATKVIIFDKYGGIGFFDKAIPHKKA